LTVYFPVWQPPCTRIRFTVLGLCSDEFAVHSCSLLCLSAEANCETCLQIVLLLDFIAWQYHGNESSRVHFAFCHIQAL